MRVPVRQSLAGERFAENDEERTFLDILRRAPTSNCERVFAIVYAGKAKVVLCVAFA